MHRENLILFALANIIQSLEGGHRYGDSQELSSIGYSGKLFLLIPILPPFSQLNLLVAFALCSKLDFSSS